jgi:alkyl sulfatase BDS1-like metallo-beta-lactamase superfamily hydrolase
LRGLLDLALPQCWQPPEGPAIPDDWAKALLVMADLRPELLLPAHGLPIGGADRIQTVLDDVASVLEDLVDNVLSMMNDGASFDEIVHSVRVPEATLALPYLRPLYDEPEFVVRNIWWLYGGWWDANPARLIPAPDAALAREVTVLAGGLDRLVQRARTLSDAGKLDLACQLVE